NGQAPFALRHLDGRQTTDRRGRGPISPVCRAREGSGDEAARHGQSGSCVPRRGEGWKGKLYGAGIEGNRRAVTIRDRRRRSAPGPVRDLVRFGDVAGLRALRTIDDLELDRLALLERPEPVALDRREVD